MDELGFSKGSIIGAFIGDATGAYLEFKFPYSDGYAEKALTLPGGGKLNIGSGQFTDDSEMAMCQINALKSKKPADGFPADEILAWYRKWAFSAPFDMGTTCRVALSVLPKLGLQEHILRVSTANAQSKANGSMMRMTPLCVWVRNLPVDQQVASFRLDSQLTHPNSTVLDACSAYGLAIANLIKTQGDVSRTLTVVENWLQTHANKEVNSWFEESNMDNLDHYAVYPLSGFVRWGFTLAFYFLRQNTDYRSAIKQTITLGGDRDTNAAIVGGMVGASKGIHQIPTAMVDKMINYTYDKRTLHGHLRPDYLSPNNLHSLIGELFSGSL